MRLRGEAEQEDEVDQLSLRQGHLAIRHCTGVAKGDNNNDNINNNNDYQQNNIKTNYLD